MTIFICVYEWLFYYNLQGKYFFMKQHLDQLNNDIGEIVEQSKNEISENKRKKYSSMLVLDIYHRDIIESFIINK